MVCQKKKPAVESPPRPQGIIAGEFQRILCLCWVMGNKPTHPAVPAQFLVYKHVVHTILFPQNSALSLLLTPYMLPLVSLWRWSFHVKKLHMSHSVHGESVTLCLHASFCLLEVLSSVCQDSIYSNPDPNNSSYNTVDVSPQGSAVQWEPKLLYKFAQHEPDLGQNLCRLVGSHLVLILDEDGLVVQRSSCKVI